ncbi:MAG: enoyl-CoA hydratase-related protein [Gemmatimonadota bacterium]
MTRRSGVLEVRVEGGIAILTLNRPEKRNALNRPLVDALRQELHRLADDESVRVVALRGNGKDFSAGADLEELRQATQQGVAASLEDARALGDLLLAFWHHPCPVVAAVKGRALAGGAGLVAACDLVVAEEDAEFGFPEVHLGFVPAMVMGFLQRKVGSGSALEWSLLGGRISASQALQAGLVNRVVPGGGFEVAVEHLLMELASRPPGAVAHIKALVRQLDGMEVEEGVRMGAELNAQVRQGEECRKGVEAFLGRAGSNGGS